MIFFRWNLWTHLYLVRFSVFLAIFLNRLEQKDQTFYECFARSETTHPNPHRKENLRRWGVLALGRASLAVKAPSELEMKTEWLVLSRIFQDCIRHIHTAGTFLLGIAGFPHPWLWFFMRMLFEPGRIGLWMVLIFASHKEQSHGKSSLCEQTTFCAWHWNISEHQPGPLNSKGLGTNMILKYPEGTSHGFHLKHNILVGDWNMAGLWLSIQLGMENHPNWRTPSFFRGAGQPPTRLLIVIMDHSLIPC